MVAQMADTLLKIRELKIDGRSDETWTPIVKGIDLDLCKGEVLGLIGESGAGKSTVGLAAMGFARDGCRISGGSVEFDGVDLVKASASIKRSFLGRRIAYVAQSAAASFNPAHRLINQHTEAPVHHGLCPEVRAKQTELNSIANSVYLTPKKLAFVIHIKSLVANFSVL